MVKKKANNRKKNWSHWLVGTIFLLLSSGLIGWSRHVAGSGEWYATTVYPFFRRFVMLFTGGLPFSIAELGLYLILILLVVSLVRAVYGRWKQHQSGLFLRWASRWFLTGSILLLLYTLGCGLNYQRSSFVKLAGMPQKNYTVTELAATCHWLTDQVNQATDKVSRAADGQMVLTDDYRTKASEVMAAAGEEYPSLAGDYPPVKSLLWPGLLSYQQLTGIYSPFTVEANVNQAMTAFNLPFTACHELAHFQGFMSEDEANFIAYLACRESKDAEFVYSGTLNAWQYAMNRLRQQDAAAYQLERERLADSVEVDLQADTLFWQQYDGRVAQWQDQVNDNYLKAHGQTAGVATYGGLTDFVVNEYLQKIAKVVTID